MIVDLLARMYILFNCMLSKFLLLTTPLLVTFSCAKIYKLMQVSSLKGWLILVDSDFQANFEEHSPSAFHLQTLQPNYSQASNIPSLSLLQFKSNFPLWLRLLTCCSELVFLSKEYLKTDLFKHLSRSRSIK